MYGRKIFGFLFAVALLAVSLLVLMPDEAKAGNGCSSGNIASISSGVRVRVNGNNFSNSHHNGNGNGVQANVNSNRRRGGVSVRFR